jgi:hypothetical protein
MICKNCPAKISILRLDGNLKKALAIRLQFILTHEKNGYDHWLEHIKPRLTATRASQVDRMLKQRLQALKIVIWMLTPSMEREDDFPGFWKN